MKSHSCYTDNFSLQCGCHRCFSRSPIQILSSKQIALRHFFRTFFKISRFSLQGYQYSHRPMISVPWFYILTAGGPSLGPPLSWKAPHCILVKKLNQFPMKSLETHYNYHHIVHPIAIESSGAPQLAPQILEGGPPVTFVGPPSIKGH